MGVRPCIFPRHAMRHRLKLKLVVASTEVFTRRSYVARSPYQLLAGNSGLETQ